MSERDPDAQLEAKVPWPPEADKADVLSTVE